LRLNFFFISYRVWSWLYFFIKFDCKRNPRIASVWLNILRVTKRVVSSITMLQASGGGSKCIWKSFIKSLKREMMEIKHNFSWICIWVSEWVEFNAPLDTIWKMISSDKSLLAGESADQGTWSSAVVLISVSEAPAVDNSLSQSTSPYSVPRYRLSTFGRRTFPSLVLLHGTLYQIVSIIQHWVLTVLETTENRNGIIWDLLKPH